MFMQCRYMTAVYWLCDEPNFTVSNVCYFVSVSMCVCQNWGGDL